MKKIILTIGMMLVWSIYGVTLFVSSTCSAASYPTSTATPLANDLSMNQYKLTDVGDIITKGPWVDVRAFGADGSDELDDTQAFINAIATLRDGYTLFVPSGIVPSGTYKYKINQPLVIAREWVRVTGGGIIEGTNVNGYVLTFGDGLSSFTGSRLDHIKIQAYGNLTTGGVRWRHVRNFVMDNVEVENDYLGGNGIGVLVEDGCFLSTICNSHIYGTFGTGVKLDTGVFASKPNGFRLSNNSFVRIAPQGGTGLHIVTAAISVLSEGNYYEDWSTGLRNQGGGLFKSIADHFKDSATGILIENNRSTIISPSFSGTHTTGIDLSTGSYNSVVRGPLNTGAITGNLVEIRSGVNEIVVETESPTRVNDAGSGNTVYSSNFGMALGTNPMSGFRRGINDQSAGQGYYSLISTDVGKVLTNMGAGGDRTFNLPPAAVGLHYTIVRIAYNLRIDPYGTENIRGGGAGKYLSLDSDGTIVELVATTTGKWELISVRGTTSFEP